MKKNRVKKIIFLLFLTLYATAGNAAESTQQKILAGLKEYTLENGLEVFVLEDLTSAEVRIEYTVRAGYSAQTRETDGFFPLYTRLFASSGKAAYTEQQKKEPAQDWFTNGINAECNADSARYSMTVAPDQTETVLKQLSCCIFSPRFSNTDISLQLSALKTEVMHYAYSTAGFINSSIDARIFSDAPWKQESGIYPAVFKNLQPEEARSVLVSIGRTHYIPENSALFISGGIKDRRALELVKKYFLAPSISRTESEGGSKGTTKNKQRRFVLSDPLLTADMAQIVIQYTSLSMAETDIAAAAFDSDTSTLKTALLSKKKLAIRGSEYISAASAHKNGSSRLIFQSLLEKRAGVSPVTQAEQFVDGIKSAADLCTENEYAAARQRLVRQFGARFGNSADSMNLLAQFWAVDATKNTGTDSLAEKLLSWPKQLSAVTDSQLVKAYDSETPFVFVLVNSNVYTAYAAAFKKAGYESVTAKNGSWYTQKLNGILNVHRKQDNSPIESGTDTATDFTDANRSLFSSFTLSNGIPVIIKKNSQSVTAVISMDISRGKQAAADPEIETVLINGLADNIRMEIRTSSDRGTISGIPEVKADTGPTVGTVMIKCLSEDIDECIRCMSEALVRDVLIPAQADRLVYDLRTQQRIQAGSTAYQLFAAAAAQLYKGTPFADTYRRGDAGSRTISYMDLQAAYPSLLDAARYRFILAGAIPEETLRQTIETSFGILIRQTSEEGSETDKKQAVPIPDFSGSAVRRIKLQHRFLTDSNADSAGPRPEILVPTKDFADPVQYWLSAPNQSSSDFTLFNALLYEINYRLKTALEEASEEIGVHVSVATAENRAAVITFSDVHHTNTVDRLYKTVVNALNKDLSPDAAEQSKTVGEIRNRWILNALAGTKTHEGTIELIRRGIERGGDAQKYISDYTLVSKAKASDFYRVAEEWLPDTATLRLYSADSKR